MNQIESRQQYIDGRWRARSSATERFVTDPATEQVLAFYPAAAPLDVASALAASRAGFDAWRQRTALDRADGRVIPSRWPGTRFHTAMVPVGPVAVLTPCNFIHFGRW